MRLERYRKNHVAVLKTATLENLLWWHMISIDDDTEVRRSDYVAISKLETPSWHGFSIILFVFNFVFIIRKASAKK